MKVKAPMQEYQNYTVLEDADSAKYIDGSVVSVVLNRTEDEKKAIFSLEVQQLYSL